MSLGEQSYISCPSADSSRAGEVTVDEIIAMTGRALNGCPSKPEPLSCPGECNRHRIFQVTSFISCWHRLVTGPIVKARQMGLDLSFTCNDLRVVGVEEFEGLAQLEEVIGTPTALEGLGDGRFIVVAAPVSFEAVAERTIGERSTWETLGAARLRP